MAYTLNGLTIEVYDYNIIRIVDPGNIIARAYGLQFGTTFPGGLYADCSFYAPRDLASYWDVRGAKRVVIRNGQRVVYEGKIDILSNQIDGADTGTLVQCTGYWGALAMRYALRKRWTDQRITEDVWIWKTTATGAEKCTVDRQNRIRMTPKAVAWTSGEFAEVRYRMPTGQTVKRLAYTYKLAESAGANDWEIGLYRSTDESSWTEVSIANGDSADTTITATGTAAIDVTLGTASQYIRFALIARDNQTPTSDGTYYGQFSAMTVYGETGTIDAEEVTYDVIGLCSEISASLGSLDLGAETLPALPRFLFDDFTSIADILTAAGSFGNTSAESIYFQMLASELGEANDGEPVLSNGVYPDLSAANYIVRFGDSNIVSAQIERDYSRISNWIPVTYLDERMERQTITPDDAAYPLLTDATSVANYGRRVFALNAGMQKSRMAYTPFGHDFPTGERPHLEATGAYYVGQRYLARWKDPAWKGSVTVTGYVLGVGGNRIPASEIEAGKVLDLANYVVDEVLADDTLDNPRVIITATSYDNDSEACTIAFGPLDDLVQPEAYFLPRYPAAIIESGGATSGGKGKLNWKRKMGLKPGTAEWDEAMKLGKKAWMEKYPNWKKKG